MVFAEIGGQPLHEAGADDTRNDRDQGKADDLMLQKHAKATCEIGRAVLFLRVLTVLDNALLFKNQEGKERDERHHEQDGAADGEYILPRQERGKDAREGRTEERGEGIAEAATCGMDGLRIFCGDLGHRPVDHCEEEAAERICELCNLGRA